MKNICLTIMSLLTACLFLYSNANADQSRIDTILKRGTLVVGTTGHYPPLTVESASGKLIGLDMDLANLMAKAMGVNVKVVRMAIDALLPALAKGKVDMVIAGLTITPKRNLEAIFAGPYFVTGQSILTKQENISNMKGPDDINRPDFKLAVAAGTTGAEVAKALLPKADIKAADNMQAALTMLLEGRVDAIMADQPFCVVSAFLNQDKGLASSDPFTFEPLGIALPRNDVLLMNWVQNFLMMMEANGQLKQLKQYWFTDPSWMRQLPDQMLKGKTFYRPVI